MNNLRTYGKAPFEVAVIHGGPGALGEMAPVAKVLSQNCGVLEPLQTATSINDQLQELLAILEQNGKLPMILVGHSWGAWLSFIFAAKYPLLIKKLILIGSGPFEEEYVPIINEIRSKRLSQEENNQVQFLVGSLNDPNIKNKQDLFRQFSKLMSKTDSVNPISSQNNLLDLQPEIFLKVFQEGQNMRKDGELLLLGYNIKCPVMAIHGEYDPHPYQGVQKPLAQILPDFRFILLKDCGHYPWNELEVKDSFYEILKKEIN